MKIDYDSMERAKKLIDEHRELQEKREVLNMPSKYREAYVVVKAHSALGDRQIELPLPVGCWQRMKEDVLKRMIEIEKELEEL